MSMDMFVDAVIRVGDGRGFVVDGSSIGRVVLTAAHCLPDLPPPIPAMHPRERTYRSLLGRIGSETTVTAECCFVDPMADLAVLWAPERSDASVAYEALVDDVTPLRVGFVEAPCLGWAMPLSGEWLQLPIRVGEFGPARFLRIDVPDDDTLAPGTSGSPVLNPAGHAVGLVSIGGGDPALDPLLANVLPGWLLRELRANKLDEQNPST